MAKTRYRLHVVLRLAELRRDRIARRMAQTLRAAATHEMRARRDANQAAAMREARRQSAPRCADAQSLAAAQAHFDNVAAAAARLELRAEFAARDAALARNAAAQTGRALAGAGRVADGFRDLERRSLERSRRADARRVERREADVALEAWAAMRRTHGN